MISLRFSVLIVELLTDSQCLWYPGPVHDVPEGAALCAERAVDLVSPSQSKFIGARFIFFFSLFQMNKTQINTGALRSKNCTMLS